MATWDTDDGPDEACPACGAVYAVSVTHLPTKDRDRYDCSQCGHQMRNANSTSMNAYTLKPPPPATPE